MRDPAANERPGRPEVSVFRITPPEIDFYAERLVLDILFEMQFSAEIPDGSEILITAPDGFPLAETRTCDGKIGRALGGVGQDLGFGGNIEHCAELVWDLAPRASIASWSTVDLRCYAYEGATLEICAAIGETSVDCSGYIHHVCSFATVTRACQDFAWRSAQHPRSSPTCEDNTMMMQLRGDNISSGAMTSFVVSTRNPQKSPPLVRNFWVLEHYMPDQTIRYSGLLYGWAVIPLLTEVTVRMTGLLRGPGSLTQLTVSFMPTSNAEEVQITALMPQGFDFGLATASLAGAPLNVTSRGPSNMTLRMAIVGLQALAAPVVIEGVRLPPAHGQAQFSLRTLFEQLKVDENEDVSGNDTFLVPGLIEVLEQQLETNYTPESDRHQVSSPLRPRISDGAVATFVFTASRATEAGDQLFISAPPFTFPGGLFTFQVLMLDGQVQETVNVTAVTLPGADGAVGGRLRADLPLALAPGTRYRTSLATNTGGEPESGELWLLELKIQHRGVQWKQGV